jgi:hypothetical protein
MSILTTMLIEPYLASAASNMVRCSSKEVTLHVMAIASLYVDIISQRVPSVIWDMSRYTPALTSDLRHRSFSSGQVEVSDDDLRSDEASDSQSRGVVAYTHP